MKTKAFLLVCLFLGIGLTRLCGQEWPPPPPDNKNNTGSVVTFESFVFGEPVFSSDGQIIDWINGPITAHYIRHYKSGKWISEIAHFYGDLTSDATGEVFSYDEHYKTREVGINGDGHYIATGNAGTVLNIFYHIDIYWDGIPLYSNVVGVDFILVKVVRQ